MGGISGTVVSADGKPAPRTEVNIADLHRQFTTDAAGKFQFENLPAGTYLIEAISPKFGSAVAQVPVVAGQTAEVRISLDLTVHHEDVVVTASPYARGGAALGQSVSVIDGTELQEKTQPSLGETLAREPGVVGSSYSPGASRPIIRGQAGNRVRVLEDGMGVADASNVSEDHAVSLDALGADRIEVVRGPGTLLYGGNAVGGVVNVLDNRVPDHTAATPISGWAEGRYSSNAGDGDGAVALDGGAGQFGWHADALNRNSGDFKTPEGTLHNSDVDTEHGSLGASWIGKQGFVGVAWSKFRTNYGIPTDEMVRIDLDQSRWDLHGEYNAPMGFLRAIRLRYAQTDYQHSEIEDTGAIGTSFFNNSWEGRLEFSQREIGRLKGAFGVQAANRDFEAVGEEGFVPPTSTLNKALFAFEEIAAGPVSFELAARYEHQDNGVTSPTLPERSFSGTSGSGGVVWHMPKDYVLAFTVSSAVRLPAPEELYANGPHLATFQFEIGDPTLDTETSLGYDLSFRRTAGRVSGEISLFQQSYNGFIFLAPTGNTVDVDGELVPEFLYDQSDTDFRGAEAHLDIELLHKEPHHVELEFLGDTVRAEESDSGDPLPMITPARYGVGVHYRGPRLWGYVEGRRTLRQDRVATFETETDGYTWLNASVGWRFVAAGMVSDIILRGLNLTDELSLNHVSPLKEVVPLPGRDLSLSYRLTF